jgi:hypothetical protein
MNPPPSRAAREREQVLLRLPVKELVMPGAQLVSEVSEAGRRDGGSPAKQGVDVRVERDYTVPPPYPEACAALLGQFSQAGWNFGDESCTSGPNVSPHSVLLNGQLPCSGFVARTRLLLYTADYRGVKAGSLTVTILAPYPGDEPTNTTAPVPAHASCS